MSHPCCFRLQQSGMSATSDIVWWALCCACSTGRQACWISGSSQTGSLQHHCLRRQRWRTRCGAGGAWALCSHQTTTCRSDLVLLVLHITKYTKRLWLNTSPLASLHAASRAAGEGAGSIRTSSTVAGKDWVPMACRKAPRDMQHYQQGPGAARPRGRLYQAGRSPVCLSRQDGSRWVQHSALCLPLCLMQ